MKLEEFDLDLPYIPNEEFIKREMNNQNLSLREAKRLDYQQNWKGKRQSFRMETRCITSMFERLMSQFENDLFWKCLIEVVNEKKEDRIINLSGVGTVKVIYSYDDFQKLNTYNKKKKTLEILWEGIQKISKEYKWNEDEFCRVKNLIINNDYQNTWYWAKSLKSPNQKYSADILCDHEVDVFWIKLQVKNEENQIIKEESLKELPDEFAYSKHLGKLEWDSNNDVVLYNDKGNETLSINL